MYTTPFFRDLRWCGIILALWMVLIAPRIVRAVEPAPKISDREIIESPVEIKGDIKRLEGEIKRLDQRFDELRGFMLWGFGVNFAGMFSLIGFVLWDRRTALAPAIAKNKELEERATRIENILKEVIQRDSNLAEALRHARLL